MDENKFQYFLAEYKALDDSRLAEVVSRYSGLADEAAEALQQVCQSRNINIPKEEPIEEPLKLSVRTDADIAIDKQHSIELWNSALSKNVQFHFFLMGAMVAGIGSQILGALWTLVLGICFGLLFKRIGRVLTKYVCANSEKTIEEKKITLQKIRFWCWPAALIPIAFAGTILNMLLMKFLLLFYA
nr:hypothetical protein [uncultured Undibacterium sp.]